MRFARGVAKIDPAHPFVVWWGYPPIQCESQEQAEEVVASSQHLDRPEQGAKDEALEQLHRKVKGEDVPRYANVLYPEAVVEELRRRGKSA